MSTTPGTEDIVITGCGWVMDHRSGSTAELVRPGVAPGAARADDFSSARVADSLLDAFPHLPNEVKRDRGAWITAIAIEHALSEAGLARASRHPERTGMAIGCSLAGQSGMIEFACSVREQSPRFVSPINFPQTVGNYIAGAIARSYDLRGPNLTLASGAASGLDAIVAACDILEAGYADVMLAGATEPRSDTLTQAFVGEGRATTEGACWFVLQRGKSLDERRARCVVGVRSQSSSAHGTATPWGSLSLMFGLLATLALRTDRAPDTALATSLGNAVLLSTHGPAFTVSGGSAADHVTSISVSVSGSDKRA